MDKTAEFYSRPSHGFRGGAFNVFEGSRRQRGGGFFGSLKSNFMPIFESLGKSALSSGVGLAQDVISDKFMGKNIKKSLIRHGKSRALDFAKTAANTAIEEDLLSKLTGMIGLGSRKTPRKRLGRKAVRRRKSKKVNRRRPQSRKPVSRKRQARSKSSHQRKAKKRRVASNF